MGLAEMNLLDLVGMFVGLVLTLSVFSYILGDNVLFRIAIHIFIGVTAGYVAVVVWYNVIWPQLILPLLGGNLFMVAPPFVLGVLLLAKAFPRFSGLGKPTMAYLVGVGAAAAIGGAVLGTVFPQINSAIGVFDAQTSTGLGDSFLLQFVNGSIILIGTVTTLAYFHFGAQNTRGKTPKRPAWIEGFSWVGRVFIAITFGVLFAGVYMAALTALIERLDFILELILSFVFP